MGSVHQALAHAKKKASEIRHERLDGVTSRIIVGTATCGISAGAKAVVDALNQEIKARNMKGVIVTETGCSGRCDLEPMVQVLKDGEAPVMYYHVDQDRARRIVQQHIQNNDIIEEWTRS